MILFLLAWFAGALTIISPCILPVLPFVFARADRPFARSGLPMLLGLAVAFAAVGSLAALGGQWAVQANGAGRMAALLLLAMFGLTLVFPALADRAMRPLVGLGARLSRSADGGAPSFFGSMALGAATGLLWAPCAGPVLGLILTSAALQRASLNTSLLLLAYAAGAATSLALALLAGARIFGLLKQSLGAGQMVRRGLGVVVILSALAIATGFDTAIVRNAALPASAGLEQWLLDRVGTNSITQAAAIEPASDLPVEGRLPSLAGATEWINSPPLDAAALRGKVVLIDFWTYSCINCLRALPAVRDWAAKYRDQGLVVIGVHAPEFAFEKDPANVRRNVTALGITYPVAMDNDYAIWRAFDNHYWPAHYFIDRQGRIRHHHFGEGGYAESEQVIRRLLGDTSAPKAEPAPLLAAGPLAAPDLDDLQSPETYIGTLRADRFLSPGGQAPGALKTYMAGSPSLNGWSLVGPWTVGPERAVAAQAGSAVTFRFHARDVHLVMGSDTGAAVGFTVLIDGQPPGPAHGEDVDPQGRGQVMGQRLYNLVRQQGGVDTHDVEIRFDGPGAAIYAFTFG